MVERSEVLEILRKNITSIDVDSLDFEISLKEQGLDSLDLISTLFVIEEKYGIKVSEKDIDEGKLESINQIVQYITSILHRGLNKK
jgi:acyl carrier protein